MGSRGFELAADLVYQPGEVILEVGADRHEGSTRWLAAVGPLVVTVDVDAAACERAERILPEVQILYGLAEQVLLDWRTPTRFAWLDGHDWPYVGPEYPPGCWDEQERQYLLRGQDYSQEASQYSHLRIAGLIADSIVPGGVVAFDDTWQDGSGWDGKGGTAIPHLLGRGFEWMAAQGQMVALRRLA